jgi:hypothetical protein
MTVTRAHLASSRWGAVWPALGLIALGALGGCESRHVTTAPAGTDTRLLFDLNARVNDGRTVRWASLPIPVFTNGIAHEDEVTAWTRATGGIVTFTFVAQQPAHGISFRGGSGSDICGLATVEYDDDGRILAVDVQIVLAIYRSSLCVGTVTHEVGHAIGYLAHTANGGLMDADSGNGRITADDGAFIRALYALSPGTFVGSAESTRARAGRAGRRVVTIIDPVKR